MAGKPAHRTQGGYTLIELLVVMLVIGILVSIALTQFTGQRDKAHDAAAKSDARNVAGALEGCYGEAGDYRSCATPTRLAPVGSTFGSAAGEVEVAAPTDDAYTVTAHSRSGTDFIVARAASGAQERRCTQRGRNGCPSDGSW